MIPVFSVTEFWPTHARGHRPMYTCCLDGCKGAWGTVNDMFAHVRKELHLKNFLIKENPDKYQAAMPKNMVIIAAEEYETDHGGREFRKRQLKLIDRVWDDRKYDELDKRPKSWSAPKGQSSSHANPNQAPLGHRQLITPDNVDNLLGIRKFVPKQETPVKEFLDVHYNMRYFAPFICSESNFMWQI